MDFLKAVFGDKKLTYEELVNAINAHNGNEENKDNLIKLANLSSGEYVSKGKHDSELEKLQNLLSGKDTELNSANALIAELKKGTKGNEELQGKITGYESQVAQLQAELAETKIKSALKVGLLAEKCDDVDYITFLIEKGLKEQGKKLELDDNDAIKGWDDLITGIKTQQPTHFANENRKVIPNKLPEQQQNNQTGLTKESFAKMGYQSRLKLKQEQPEVYAQMTGKTDE